MKKHMTLEQFFDAVGDANVEVYSHTTGRVNKENYTPEMMQLPVRKIVRTAENMEVYIGTVVEVDEVEDKYPTFKSIVSAQQEALQQWFDEKYDSMRSEVIQEIVAGGEWDDEIIERYLADTEWKSIDEMTEEIGELREKVEEMQDAIEEIYNIARDHTY